MNKSSHTAASRKNSGFEVNNEPSENFINHESPAKEGKVLPVCCRCATVPKNGLYDGFRLKGMFFCSDCQQELFSAEQDSPEYREFLFLIQGILFDD